MWEMALAVCEQKEDDGSRRKSVEVEENNRNKEVFSLNNAWPHFLPIIFSSLSVFLFYNVLLWCPIILPYTEMFIFVCILEAVCGVKWAEL